jgi:hypothetical protein
MSKKRYKRHRPEEIIAHLRHVDVLVSQDHARRAEGAVLHLLDDSAERRHSCARSVSRSPLTANRAWEQEPSGFARANDIQFVANT